mgnify:CR=1 FL=1
MERKIKSSIRARREQGGFLQAIIAIVIALLLMNYFNISVSEAIDWIKSLLNKALEFIKSI